MQAGFQKGYATIDNSFGLHGMRQRQLRRKKIMLRSTFVYMLMLNSDISNTESGLHNHLSVLCRVCNPLRLVVKAQIQKRLCIGSAEVKQIMENDF